MPDPQQESANETAASADEAFNQTLDEVLDSVNQGNAPESRDEEIARLRRDADEANKRVLQAQAEAENFRKRMRRDTEDQLRYAAVPLVLDILQVRDNLLRAIEAADQVGDATEASGLREGVSIVLKQLDDAMAKHGVTEIPAVGQMLDPNVHNVISQMPSPDHETLQIIHVAAAGFQMHDRVIRPSQVIVSS